MLVKACFLKDGKLSSKSYTYSIAEEIVKDVEVGTTVLISSGKAVITEINVPQESITFPLDKLKTIDTLAEVKEPEEKPITGFKTDGEPNCFKPNNNAYPLCDGNGSKECETCSFWEELEPDDLYE